MTELTLLKDHLISENLYTDEVYKKFIEFYELVQETNKVMNLTAITDEKEFQTKHFIDSVLPYKNFVNSKNVADIGSGAGFPAIPLAIILPKVNFTLVDSLQKRVNFLNNVIQTLGLENCRAVHSRAEDFAKEGREKYDAVTARAVAALNILLEYTAPLAKTGGTVLAYKGSGAIEEISAAENAAKILGCLLENTLEFYLPDGEKRLIPVYKKIRSCDKKYPRGGNKPRLAPLV